MTPWRKIKTSTNAAEKIERLQGVASEPGLMTDNIGFEYDVQQKKKRPPAAPSVSPKMRRKVRFPLPSKDGK